MVEEIKLPGRPIPPNFRRRKVSCKRTWPPRCGRSPPPPPVAAEEEEEVKGKEVAATAVDPTSLAGAPTSLSGAPTSAAGDPTSLAGAPTSLAGAPTSAAGAPTSLAGAPTSAAGAPLPPALPPLEAVQEEEVKGKEVVALVACNGSIPSLPLAAAEDMAVEENGVAVPPEEGSGGRAPDGCLEVTGGGDAGVRRRRFVPYMYPPPKRRPVSAKRTFPPRCGRSPPRPPLPESSEVVTLQLQSAGSSEKKKVAGNGEVQSDDGALEGVGHRAHGILREEDATGEKMASKRGGDERVSKVEPLLLQPEAAMDAVRDDAKEAGIEDARQPSVVVEASVRHGPSDKVFKKRLQDKGKSAARPSPTFGAAEGDKAGGRPGGSLQMVVAEACAKVSSDEKMKGKRLLECEKMNGAPSEVAKGASEDDRMRSNMSSMKKVSGLKHKKRVRLPVKVATSVKNFPEQKQDDMDKPGKDVRRSSPVEDKEEAEHANHADVAANQMIDDDALDGYSNQLIVQALMAKDKCPWMNRRKSIASVSRSFAPQKKLKKDVSVQRKLLPKKAASSSKMINKEKVDSDDDSKSPNAENPKALVVYEGRGGEFCVNLPPCVPSEWGQHSDVRSRTRWILKLFQMICRKLLQLEESKRLKISRIDVEASNMIKEWNGYTKHEAIIGNVPGVEVGDEFHYRVELAIVGLHRPFQAGIDVINQNGVLLATSIVASGGYPDELSSSDVLTYTGSGGKASGKKEAEDQKLKRGNLALKNSIEAKTPVRVIHGFKGLSRSEPGDSRAKKISTFTYDGLYMVEECWQEGEKGSMVFKYRLRRVPGQPELALHIVKKTKKSKKREGLRLPDISHGKEKIPICVINTVDDELPAPFKYITNIIYPQWYEKERPKGCDCTNGCSDSARCACAVKNGGEIPFNFNGAIVHAKPLIYECGPSCRCPPTCHNRVSQRGIRIPLEVFKTDSRGWGVRSLSSIPSGSFVCEYVGELLQDEEAEARSSNDEYLFDIGHNYDDEELWKGLPSIIPGLQSSSCCQTEEHEGFTIDAAQCGNIGRFINHSCLPNLYAQNVLYDHDHKRMPHIMFFAAENIPPLQELTYHYNYNIGEVQDKDGKERIKKCYCGAPKCSGRLY